MGKRDTTDCDKLYMYILITKKILKITKNLYNDIYSKTMDKSTWNFKKCISNSQEGKKKEKEE